MANPEIKNIKTDGSVYIGGDATSGRDLVGRDQINVEHINVHINLRPTNEINNSAPLIYELKKEFLKKLIRSPVIIGTAAIVAIVVGFVILHFFRPSFESRQPQSMLTITKTMGVTQEPIATLANSKTQISIPLSTGWNSFTYTINEEQTIAEVLHAIKGLYTTIWEYDPAEYGRWKLYDPALSGVFGDNVNTLHTLKKGGVYYISVTQNTILQIEGTVSMPSLTSDAIYFGFAQLDFLPTTENDTEILATINGTICGQGNVHALKDKIAYYVAVKAADKKLSPHCGMYGSIIKFQIGTRIMATTGIWDNQAPNPLDLYHEMFQATDSPLETP